MRAFSFIILPLLVTFHYSDGYAISPYGRYASGYTSSYSSGGQGASALYSSGGQGAYSNCCQLNPWAYGHMNAINQFADRLRTEYNRLAQGARTNYFSPPWSVDLIHLTGKTQSELDYLTRNLSEQLVNDIRKGVLNYQNFVQPNFFEWKAAEALKRIDSNFNQWQQQQQLLDDDFFKTGTSSAYRPFTSASNKWGGYHTGSVLPAGPSYISPGGTGSTVTVTHVNKNIITHPDGTNTVSGSEVNKKWVDGKLTYDSERPFGAWSVPRDEPWKREEREQFFWFLTQGATTAENLALWQRQQEERLQALAQRHQIPIAVIYEWQRGELQRYHELLRQYQAKSHELSGWQRLEAERLDWLIHQNSLRREELERWQRENQSRLLQLARQYQISLEELKRWQLAELNRVYIYFNDQKSTMMQHQQLNDNLRQAEEERLQELIRQHNRTIAQFQESIKTDQQKLIELSKSYNGNVQDMEAWLKAELARIHGAIGVQHQEVMRLAEWQRSERQRLESIVKQHQGSVVDIEQQMQLDRTYMQALAAKYKVSIEELERWERAELERLRLQGQSQLELDVKEWQLREREHLLAIISKNDLTIGQFQQMIASDRARLEELARTYKIQMSEVDEWLKREINVFKSQGLLKEVEMELAQWQQQERTRLLAFVKQHELTVEELEERIKHDQAHLNMLASTYHVQMTDIEKWLKEELLRMQSEGLIKVEDLKEWQRSERAEMLKLAQQNKLTIEEFEQKLLTDRRRLQELASTYNVQISEIEAWIKKEGARLHNLGLLQLQEHLSNWQKIERERLLTLIRQNNFTIEELEQKIKMDHEHLYSLARQHHVRVEEIEEWIKKEIRRLQQEGMLEMEKLVDWQTEWRSNLTNLVRERDFTVEEFHKWLLEDRARLQAMAMQHNVELEEIERWIRAEEKHFISMGLLKPYEKLTNWQQIERNYLERITQERFQSTEQLEARLRQDRELIEKLARDYSVQVEEIERWMKKELARLRDDGKLQIENLTAWQIAERERLEELIKQQKQYSVEEFAALLRQDREHLQKMAFQYHTSVEEIEKWVAAEVERLREQGKLNVERLTVWQKAERQRILNLLEQHSSITLEEFERKVENDRSFLMQLAQQHRVNVAEIETYIKQVIEDLRAKGKFELENLQAWQRVEHDYIKQLIAQYKNSLSTREYEEKLLNDRIHLQQLSDQYRISQKQIEQWMIEELHRLRQGSANSMQQLSAWQQAEVQRLKELIRQNSQLSYVQYELQLMQERERLQELAQQYSLSVEQIENWLRQQLVNLKTTGDVQLESLTQWQQVEQKRLIEMLLQQQHQISFEEFEQQLKRDRAHLEQLARQYSITVEGIESYMRDEFQRLRRSGLLQVEELNAWQKLERENLRNWLSRQNNIVTTEQFNEFLARDRARLQQIAQDYRITVEDVRKWVQQEGARLRVLGLIKPESLIKVEEPNDMWKEQTRAHLEAIAQVRRFMTWPDFERYLLEEHMRWEQFARQYHITVEDIERHLRHAAEDLVKQGLIQGAAVAAIQEWQVNEQAHLQQLINERLRKQQKWSIEELERKLKADQQHLQQLALKYQLTIEQIEQWYKQELQRLVNQGQLVSEHLNAWQQREKERIYWIVMRQPRTSSATLTKQLLSDRNTLSRLAGQYHCTLPELELWIRDEVKRLQELDLITVDTLMPTSNWKQQENERLHAIAAEISISKEELLELIETDNLTNGQLTELYGCAQSELAPTQHIIINSMQSEGLLDQTKHLILAQWQKTERDHLYALVKNPNFDLKQHQLDDLVTLEQSAAKYGITLEELKQWQLRELERLQTLAAHYQMTLQQLQDFRLREFQFINYVMHKQLSNEAERIHWGVSESKRMAELEKRTGLSGVKLLEWRRKLYLLCQGLIPIDFDASKDRVERDEKPQLEEGQQSIYSPSPTLTTPIPKPRPYPSYLPPSLPSYGGVRRMVGGVASVTEVTPEVYTQSTEMSDQQEDSTQQQETELTSTELSSTEHSDYDVGQKAKDLGQQQQLELEDFLQPEDLGQQQQQQELEDFNQQDDLGQQQQQLELEDFNQQEDVGQQQLQVEDFSGEGTTNQYDVTNQKQMVPAANLQNQQRFEVKAEKDSPGFFSKLKSKIFG